MLRPLTCLLFAALTTAPMAQIQINEVMAFNATTLRDPDYQEPSDWVEIINRGEEPIPLDGYALSDSPNNPDQWSFPEGLTLLPMEPLLIWLDGEEPSGEAVLHADLKLNSGGDTLLLSQRIASDEWRGIDAVVFDQQRADVSLVRSGNETFSPSIHPTPGSPNSTLPVCEAPRVNPAFGRHNSPVPVEITSAPGTVVRYTVDGSEPTEDSMPMPSSFGVQRTVTLRVRAFAPDHAPSETVTVQHFISEPTTLPIIGLAVDPSDFFDTEEGLFSNLDGRGRSWEIPVQVALLPADGLFPRVLDAGLRLHGGVARQLEKKSLRLVFRDEYSFGDFPVPEMADGGELTVEELVLRGGASDSFHRLSPLEATYLRDEMLRRLGSELGQPEVKGFFAAVYLNGAYQGLYNVCERVTEPFLRRMYGARQWDIVKGSLDFEQQMYVIDTVAGGDRRWRELIAWATDLDPTSPEAFAALSERIDIVNFVDHCVLNIFAQNEDWPHNNWVAARPRGDDADGLWRFFLWDTEWSFGLEPRGHQSDTLAWALNPSLHSVLNTDEVGPITILLQRLLAMPEGRALFLERTDRALNGVLHPDHTRALLAEMASEIRNEIPREIARLGREGWPLDWEGAVNDMGDFLLHRPDTLRGLLTARFELGGATPVEITTIGAGQGWITLNGETIETPFRGFLFNGSEITLTATPASDSAFVVWGGVLSSEERSIDVDIHRHIRPEIWAEFSTAP